MTRYSVQQQSPQGRQLVSEPLRIFLRLLGVVMLIAGIAAIVLLFYPGPYEVAEWMGENCVHGDPGPTRTAEQCNVLDVIELTVGAPIMVIVGLALVFTMGRSFVQPDPPQTRRTPVSQLGARTTITPFDPRTDADAARQARELLAEWQRATGRASPTSAGRSSRNGA